MREEEREREREREKCGRDKTQARGREIVRGRLKRGMKRQTAADEIHNLDPMRSLYLVWNTLLFIAEIFLRYDPPGPYLPPRPAATLRRALGGGLAKRSPSHG